MILTTEHMNFEEQYHIVDTPKVNVFGRSRSHCKYSQHMWFRGRIKTHSVNLAGRVGIKNILDTPKWGVHVVQDQLMKFHQEHARTHERVILAAPPAKNIILAASARRARARKIEILKSLNV